MGLNLPRLRRQCRRAVAGLRLDMARVADRTWQVCPPHTHTARPALHPDGALARVTALSPFRQWPQERPLIDGGSVTLRPTMAYEFRRADLVAGMLYAGPMQRAIGVQPSPFWLSGLDEPVSMREAQLVTTWSGAVFFGCLLLDDFPLELLGDGDVPRLSAQGKPSGHEADYRELLGLGPKRVHDQVHIDRLVLHDDPPYNPSKSERYRALCERLRRAVAGLPGGVPAHDPGPRVYLRRGLSGQRRLLANEPELEAALLAQGFLVLDPMTMTAAEIARAMLGARCVVSVEGSQISHAIFALADEASIVVLQPPDRFCLQYKEFADAMGHHFAFTVGEPRDGGFATDIDELLRLLDRLP